MKTNDTLRQESKEQLPRSPLTAEQILIRRKRVATAIFVLIFGLIIYWIFSPDKTSIQQPNSGASGYNVNVPEPTDEQLPDSKQAAYEKIQTDSPKRARMQSLSDFAEGIFGPVESSGGKMPPAEIKQKAQQTSLEQSTQTYRQVSKQMEDFYRPSEGQRNLQLERKVDELLERIKSDEQIKQESDRREQMMEHSYRLAAQYLNPEKSILPEEDAISQVKEHEIAVVRNVEYNTVSSLPVIGDDSSYSENRTVLRNYGFNTAVGSSYRLGPGTISACISEEQIIVPGQRVRLRLLQPLQAGEVIVPSGNLITGSASLQGERLDIHIENIEAGGHIIPVSMTVYDIDGQRGIFVPGSEGRTAAKETLADMGGSLGTNVSITRSAGQQLAMDLSRSVVQGGTQFLSQKLRAVKIKLKAGYKVLLVTKQP